MNMSSKMATNVFQNRGRFVLISVIMNLIRRNPRELSFVSFHFLKYLGETFFMPSVEKIKWVCNVPREAIKKELKLEFDLSLLSLWKSAWQNDKGTPGDFGGTLTARKNDLPVKIFALRNCKVWDCKLHWSW